LDGEIRTPAPLAGSIGSDTSQTPWQWIKRLSRKLGGPLLSHRNSALAVGFFAAIAIDSILDAGVGPWYEKVFGAPSPPVQHTVDLSSQAHVAPAASQAPVGLLVIAAREEGTADRAVIDAFTDELTDRLSGFPDLRVISRQTANLFLTKSTDVIKLGAEFGVRYVAEARLQPQSTTTRTTVALIDAADGREIWSEWAETPKAGDGVSARFAANIHVQLDHAKHDPAAAHAGQ
jgi:TolB-like protein